MQLPAGSYSFEVLLQDPSTGKTAFLEQSLHLPEIAERLDLSTIVVGKEAKRSSLTSGLLTVDKIIILPSANRRFRNGEKLLFYFEIYDFQLKNGEPYLLIDVAVMKAGSG